MKTLAVRAAAVAGAYFVTALTAFAVILVMRGTIAPARLREVLGLYFIAALAAGLEPATVRASALTHGQAPGELAGVLGASAVKGFLAAPVLAIVWRFADAGAPVALLLLTPLICVAGFWATDLRVLLDLRGRHVAAVWLKQGGLAGGVLLLALLVVLGAPLVWAALVSTVARLLPPVAIALHDRRGRGPGLTALLADARWPALAAISGVAAAGGSIDRVLALRYLPAAAYSGYVLIYELFSRFWLIPYLVTPILFARLAGGAGADVLIRRAWSATIAAGTVFVAGVAVVVALTPALAGRLFGVPVGLPEVAFAIAVVLGALTQLRIAQLQGAGAIRRALLVTALGAAAATLAFLVGVRALGLPGLMWAWLVKSTIEFAAAVLRSEHERRA